MKTLFRVLIILVVASFVGGAIFALVNAGGAATQQSSALPRPDVNHLRPQTDRHDRQGGSLFLPFGMVKNLLIISAIVAVYWGAAKWFARSKELNETSVT